MRLLLVEDDAIQRRLLVLRLAAAGLTVEQAADGLEAYQALKRLRPDALLCDLQMPKLGGFELLQRLRDERVALPATVVLFSARPPTPHESERAEALGARALLTKPIGLKELLALIGAPAKPPGQPSVQPRTAGGPR